MARRLVAMALPLAFPAFLLLPAACDMRPIAINHGLGGSGGGTTQPTGTTEGTGGSGGATAGTGGATAGTGGATAGTGGAPAGDAGEDGG